jgi:transposase
MNKRRYGANKKNVRKPVILHNARAHKARVVCELIEENGWSLLELLPDSPDMNP